MHTFPAAGPARALRCASLFTFGVLVFVAAPVRSFGQEAETVAPAPPPAATSSPAAGARPEADLHERTRGLEPGRFNVSVDGGLGLIRAVSPHTLRPGEIAASASVMNFDRHPGDVDFFEYGVQAAVGLPGRLELFVRGSPWLRTNSVNQEPFGFPVPPLDLFIDIYPTVAERPLPYFLYAQEVPFKSYYVDAVKIEPPGRGVFASSSGHLGIGAKMNLLSEDRGDPVSLGVRTYVELPTETPRYHTEEWRHVAGSSGKHNVGGGLLVARRVQATEIIANVDYRRVGDPDRGLRVQYVDSSQWGTPAFVVGPAIETKLDLHDQLTVTAGTSLRAFNLKGLQFWLLGEFGYLRYVGGGTPVERQVNPAEVRVGMQANVPKYPSVSIGAAWQLLLNRAGDGSIRRSSFVTPDGRGDINFSETVDWQLSAVVREQFTRQGITFSPFSSTVFATNNPAFDEWRNVPTNGTPVIGMGGGNVLGFITWRIN
jgi:hypothetical protein